MENTVKLILFFVCAKFLCIWANKFANPLNGDFLVVTVTTEEPTGFKLFHESAAIHGLPLRVLGLGEKWSVGGFRVPLLSTELAKHKDDTNKIILIADAYDVLFNADFDEIAASFIKTNSRILFSADSICWPDKSLAAAYDPVNKGKKYLNSGLFIGYAPELYQMISTSSINSEDSDQLFFTKIYLNATLRAEMNIKIDHRSTLFSTLNGATDSVQIDFIGKRPIIRNKDSNTIPLIIHANGPTKIFQKTFGAYILNHWNPVDGCLSCSMGTRDLSHLEHKDYPSVGIGVFVEQPTPFLDEFFHKLFSLDYPKDKIHLFIHNTAKFHSDSIDIFVERHNKVYGSVRVVLEVEFVKEREARHMAIEECIRRSCDYFFSISSVAHVDNPQMLKLLIEQNRPVISPLMVQHGKSFSNFWNSLTAEGHAARSFDFTEIVNNTRRGLWSVPQVQSCFLIRNDIVAHHVTFTHKDIRDPETAMSANFREQDVDMFVSNRFDFGHLISIKRFDVSEREFFGLQDNPLDWEKRYMHVHYRSLLAENSSILMPCPDVFYVPMTNTFFSDEILHRLKSHLTASRKNAVNTNEIHLDGIGLFSNFQHFASQFILPVQNRIFSHHKGTASVMRSMVVHYGPNDQPNLENYFSTSSYVVHLALSQPGTDYQGGGYNFTRYECSIEQIPQGWMVIYPGRLTHFHEDLETTSGSRYVLIGFIDS